MFKLQNMRDHKKLKLPMYILFGIVIVSFVFFYGWKSDSQSQNERIYAKLRSDSLHPMRRWTEINGEMLKIAGRRMADRKLAMLGPQMAQILQNQLGDLTGRLVDTNEAAREKADEILLERQARKIGLEVTLDDIIDHLESQPGISDAVLENYAQRAYGIGKLQFVELQRQTQQETQLRNLHALTAHASLFELWQEYKLGKEKLTLQVAAYPAETFQSKVAVTEDELVKHLADNKDQFHKPAQRRYAYVKLTLDDLKAKLTPTEEQIKTWWEQHQADYLIKAAVKTDEILAPLGADAASTAALTALNEVRAEAAKTADWSDLLPLLREKNPDLSFYNNKSPWLEEGSAARSPEYMQMAKTLTEDQVSSAVALTQGVYIFRVTERRAAGSQPFEEARAKAEEDWRTAEAQKQFEETFARYKDEVTRYSTMSSFAQAVGLQDGLTTRTGRTEFEIPEIGSLAKDRDYVANLALNELSGVIKSDQFLTVLQVVEETEAYDPTLQEARAEVEADLRKVKAVDLAKQAAEQAQGLLTSGADFAQALADAPKAPYTTPAFTRVEPVEGLGAPLIDFPKQTLNIAKDSTGVTAYGNDAKQPLGYAIWKVVSIEQPKQEDFVADLRQFEQDYLQIQRLAIEREWLEDLRREAQFQMVEKEK